jgi:hypothetical protein
MDIAKVKDVSGADLFGGQPVAFVRLPVQGERLALQPQAEVVGVVHFPGQAPGAIVYVRAVAAGAHTF